MLVDMSKEDQIVTRSLNSVRHSQDNSQHQISLKSYVKSAQKGTKFAKQPSVNNKRQRFKAAMQYGSLSKLVGSQEDPYCSKSPTNRNGRRTSSRGSGAQTAIGGRSPISKSPMQVDLDSDGSISPNKGLPVDEVLRVRTQIQNATGEKDFLLSSNAVKRVQLKELELENSRMKSGNVAVNRELARLDDESKMLEKSHLSTNNVILNMCTENDADCNLIKKYEESNKSMRAQKFIEQGKIRDANILIKTLKQQLIKAQKERDTIRNKVHIQRKQLDKHENNLHT